MLKVRALTLEGIAILFGAFWIKSDIDDKYGSEIMVIVYKFEANCQLCKVSGVRQVSDRGKNTVKAEILAYLYLMVLPTNIKNGQLCIVLSFCGWLQRKSSTLFNRAETVRSRLKLNFDRRSKNNWTFYIQNDFWYSHVKCESQMAGFCLVVIRGRVCLVLGATTSSGFIAKLIFVRFS